MPDREGRYQHEDPFPIGVNIGRAQRQQEQHVIVAVEVSDVLKAELEVGWEHLRFEKLN